MTASQPARTSKFDGALPNIKTAIADHETNPAYEVHLGRVVDIAGSAQRVVSIWLEGERWSGYLQLADPRDLEPPADGGTHRKRVAP